MPYSQQRGGKVTAFRIKLPLGFLSRTKTAEATTTKNVTAVATPTSNATSASRLPSLPDSVSPPPASEAADVRKVLKDIADRLDDQESDRRSRMPKLQTKLEMVNSAVDVMEVADKLVQSLVVIPWAKALTGTALQLLKTVQVSFSILNLMEPGIEEFVTETYESGRWSRVTWGIHFGNPPFARARVECRRRFGKKSSCGYMRRVCEVSCVALR
jgi:hypothetical protein